ncbi:hypothetical protein BOTBODRAFT_26700 [Botryobasidium botryosum FD-172 SS1]|uniref:RING-CH-type domain-containing protein n=1 Tax=Botryobasidium botryosum (strain FD-172 SS1) TaxID=930990 RepID=A0A067N155_BOTB1|nr:hypothetical protein BOTBODRAFT_26700 [Botryobasidium botryosum FD-172 SS1]
METPADTTLRHRPAARNAEYANDPPADAHARGSGAEDGASESQHDPLPDLAPEPEKPPTEEKQCRICLGGEEEVPEQGRLIRPCRCKGTIRYVHVGCLNTWRATSASTSAYWACPQCGFRYAFARTRAVGLASSPYVLGAATVSLFLLIAFLASFLASHLVPKFDIYDTHSDAFYSIFSYPSVRDFQEFLQVAMDIVAPVTEDGYGGAWESTKRAFTSASRGRSPKKPPRAAKKEPPAPPGFFLRIAQRLMLGTSLVGSLSFFQFLLSYSVLGIIRVFRVERGRTGRGNTTKGIGALLVLIFLAIGVARAFRQTYRLTKTIAHYLLKKTEAAIVDVAEEEDEDEVRPPLLDRVRQAAARWGASWLANARQMGNWR